MKEVIIGKLEDLYKTEEPNTHYILCGRELAWEVIRDKKDFRRVSFNKALRGSIRRFSFIEHPDVCLEAYKRDLEAVRAPQQIHMEPLAALQIRRCEKERVEHLASAKAYCEAVKS